MIKELNQLNAQLKKNGMLEMDIIDPKVCVPAPVNARYMKAETMNTLTENIKKAGNLESVPLVYVDNELPKGKYRIISGHHRIDAAKAAQLETILVMVCKPEDVDDIISKQLAHNALTGLDDKTLLAELFQSIEDVSKKIASGLTDAASQIAYASLNFRAGNFKEFTVLFLPEDIGLFDEQMEAMAANTLVKPSSEIRLTNIDYYEKFKKAIMKVKKAENIKSNGVALMRIVELAAEKMMDNHDEI